MHLRAHDNRDRAYFGGRTQEQDSIGCIEEDTRVIFGRGDAAEPGILVEQLGKDAAIAEADTLLLTVPNQLGVADMRYRWALTRALSQLAPTYNEPIAARCRLDPAKNRGSVLRAITEGTLISIADAPPA